MGGASLQYREASNLSALSATDMAFRSLSTVVLTFQMKSTYFVFT
jgi:hypothetical protein